MKFVVQKRIEKRIKNWAKETSELYSIISDLLKDSRTDRLAEELSVPLAEIFLLLKQYQRSSRLREAKWKILDLLGRRSEENFEE